MTHTWVQAKVFLARASFTKLRLMKLKTFKIDRNEVMRGDGSGDAAGHGFHWGEIKGRCYGGGCSAGSGNGQGTGASPDIIIREYEYECNRH